LDGTEPWLDAMFFKWMQAKNSNFENAVLHMTMHWINISIDRSATQMYHLKSNFPQYNFKYLQ